MISELSIVTTVNPPGPVTELVASKSTSTGGDIEYKEGALKGAYFATAICSAFV